MLSSLKRIKLYEPLDGNGRETLQCEFCEKHNGEKEGDLCSHCNDTDMWWDNISGEKALVVMEDFITSKGLFKEFSEEYLAEYFTKLLIQEVNKK